MAIIFIGKMTIGTVASLAGLLNAMIGGTMLIIPVLAMKSGYWDWIIGCLAICVITGYTAQLLVHHLGKAKNIKYLLLNHFQQSRAVTVAYNIVICFSFLSAMLVYFQLFYEQVKGLFGQFDLQHQVLAVFLVFWVLSLRNCHLSEIILASGLISVCTYIAFLIWMVSTAPEGSRKEPSFTGDSSAMMLALLNSYTVHDFMIQLITENPKRKDYPMIVLLLYIIGNFVFMFTAYSSVGLLNRPTSTQSPDTVISFFFGNNEYTWELNILEILYLVHILSSFPEYVVISKIRIFQLVNLEHDPQSSVTIGECIHAALTVFVCYLLKRLEVPLSLILDISGAVLGYIFAMLIPILIHFKCLHFDRSCGEIEGDNEHNSRILHNACQCQLTYRSAFTMWLETFVLFFVAIYGAVFFFSQLGQELQDKTQ